MTLPIFRSLFGKEASAPQPKANDVLTAETILVLEDDEWIRDIATLVLERAGYSVLAAATGEEAVELAAAPAQKHIHLLLADVVLPGISGPDAASHIQTVWPNIRVVFMSGYGDQVLRQYNTPVTHTGFIQKPFTHDALLSKVKRLLDQPHVALARRGIRKEEALDRLSHARVA